VTAAKGGGPHGILIVDKPSGPTSHDIVAQARRHFGTRRVGHGGTLDPMATGVLVLLLGEATKLSDAAACSDKRYVAEVRFGRATDSHDAEGNTTEQREPSDGWIDAQSLSAALDMERARQQQTPPVVSALKVGGQRAYRLTRAGAAPVLAPRPVRVHSLELRAWDGLVAELELSVSKGYYVRALARDLATTLGVPAHLSRLRRTRSGNFGLDDAWAWPPGETCAPLALHEVLPRLLPTLRLNVTGVQRARHGLLLTGEDFLDAPPNLEDVPSRSAGLALFAWTDAAGAPIALGQREAGGYRVRRGFTADQLLLANERDISGT
jgi:tRNA pseudouridine55 synthase